jgi:hypothetical protein
LSARWAVQRTYNEKWWERKERAYADIIDALHDLLRYSELIAEEYLTGRHEHQNKKEFEDKYTEAYWKIQKVTDIGAFTISEEATSILLHLQNRPKLKWNENPPWEIYEEDSKHYRDALTKIRKCARKELKG